MTTRKYDPLLIWSLAREAAFREVAAAGHARETLTTHDPRIYIYADGLDGAFLIQRGKLYHDPDPSDAYFSNTDEKLENYDGKLREVVVKFGRLIRAFPSWELFLIWAGLIK